MSQKNGASMLPRPLGLPDFPWDTLDGARAMARSHPDGMVDLSVGTPVDPTPQVIQEAMSAHADSAGYPLVVGAPEVREAIHAWMARRGMVKLPDAGVVPTTGSKEMVAWLPRILGVGPGDTVLYPEVAYPTYEVGAILAGATPSPMNPLDVNMWPVGAPFVWLNSPSNPTGAVQTVENLREIVAWARAHGSVVVADECYAELPWSERWIEQGVPSLLSEEVCDGDPTGLLVVYSLSKQSNMAGYRAGILCGDPALVGAVIEARKHGGMMVPAPVQAAMAAALMDEGHVADQRERYRQRREQLLRAVTACGLQVDPRTEAGLYLWLTAPKNWAQLSGGADVTTNRGRQLVDWFAALGILVAPGDFYGQSARGHVRMALTATDEMVYRACERLGEAAALGR